MELTPDLIAIQGVLTSIVKETGSFTSSAYKWPGNEDKIKEFIKKLEEILSAKGYIKNRKSIGKYDKQLDDITFFLAINSELKNNLEISEYFHLLNIIPKLSKYLLVKVIVELDLGLNYANTIHKLPIEFTSELLSEFLPCLRYFPPDVVLKNICTIEQTVIKKICDTENMDEVREHAESVVQLAVKLLQTMEFLNVEQISKWKSTKVYVHMGNTLFKLLELILYCPVTNYVLKKLFEGLLCITRSVVKDITINIYCDWAEVKVNDQNLQYAINTEAYRVVEKLHKCKPSEELIQMLKPFARKPLTVHQLINQSDIPTKIKMINRNDMNQKLWFKALLNTSVPLFENKEVRDCIKVWFYLCTIEDVTRLLNLLENKKDDAEAKAIVFKCASSLSVHDLSLLIRRYFFEKGISNHLDTGKVYQQITLLINKQTGEIDEQFIKELFLLMLQDPSQVLIYLYSECLKKTVNCQYYREIFKSFKEISQVESLSLKCVNKALENYQLTNENKMCLIGLLNTLDETENLSRNKILLEIIFPVLEKSFTSLDYKTTLLYLEVANGLSPTFTVNMDVISTVFCVLSKILKHSRCKFFEFLIIKANLVKEVVFFLEGFSSLAIDVSEVEDSLNEIIRENENKLNQFYFVRFLQRNLCLWDHVYPNSDITNHAETVANLLQILPSCTLTEWLDVFSTLQLRQGADKTIEMFTDSLVLLCHVARSQESSNENDDIPAFAALKYCLQNYGVVLKECIQSKTNKVEYEINASKCIVKLLRDLPSKLQQEDGLTIINIIPDEVLKSLAKTKSFVCSVSAIKNGSVRQCLAQKMLDS